MIVRVPPPPPEPSTLVGLQWEEKHDECHGETIYELAPAVGTYMAEVKRYFKGLKEFVKVP